MADGRRERAGREGKKRGNRALHINSLTPSIWSPTPCLWPGYRRNRALWDVIMVSWVWRAGGGGLSPSLCFPFFLDILTQREFTQEFSGGRRAKKNQSFGITINLCVCVCVFQRGETALHMAARAGQSNVVRYLIQNGARVDAKAKVVLM